MSDWFKTSLGRYLTEMEQQRCSRLIPSGYYARSLQVGFPWINYLQGVEVSSQYIINTQYPTQSIDELEDAVEQAEIDRTRDMENCHYLVSSSSALPFPEKSHDLIVMPHTLDFCDDPHEVLRQANQTLVPEGCIVIVGFNKFSFYGGVKLFKRGHKQIPWNGRYYSAGRVQDWLGLLGFDLVGAEMMSYQPPILSEKWRKKLMFVEKAGNRWWSGLGGMYIIVGRKREMSIQPLPTSTQPWRSFIPGIAQPAAQRAAKIGMKLVAKG